MNMNDTEFHQLADKLMLNIEEMCIRDRYLYNQAPTIDTIISHQPLEYNRYLNKLVAWAYFNGLLTADTKLHIKSNNNLCDCLLYTSRCV